MNALGYVACEAAYRDGEPWRQALLAYLRGNRDFLVTSSPASCPASGSRRPIEATYLAWLNVADLGLEDPAAHFEAHGVGLSDGSRFGAAAGTHVRINFGCPAHHAFRGPRAHARGGPGDLRRAPTGSAMVIGKLSVDSNLFLSPLEFASAVFAARGQETRDLAFDG